MASQNDHGNSCQPIIEKLRLGLGLNQLTDGTGRLRSPLQGEDHFGNDLHLVPGFLRLCSRKFLERFRIVSVPVGSRESRLV